MSTVVFNFVINYMTMTTQYQRGRHMNDLLFTFLRDDVALIRCDNIMKDNIGLYFFLNFLYTQGHKSGKKTIHIQ